MIKLCVTLLCLVQMYRVTCIPCGTVDLDRPLIKYGDKTTRGQWPFIAALFYKMRDEYFCGGTIISKKHVLTAAHCIQNKGTSNAQSPNEVLVRLGAYNLTDQTEYGVLLKEVKKIHIHPDWNAYSVEFDADVAILVLHGTIRFTNYIQPICLPADDVVLNFDAIDLKGFVVGWGLDERYRSQDNPKQLSTKSLAPSYCFLKESALAIISSNRTFCGDYANGTPNSGDSGGGFFSISGYAWVQFGIVSAILTNETGHTLETSPSVYGSVKSYKMWIVETVTTSGGEVGDARHNTDIKLNSDKRYRYLPTTDSSPRVGSSGRYWDCCKASCGWNRKAPFNRPVKTCAEDGVTVLDSETQSVCYNDGLAFTCNNNQPWADNAYLSYGLVSASVHLQTEYDLCCSCFEMTFTSGPVKGKKMVVQVTNPAGDYGGSNHFNIQVPGGGVGWSTNGCKPQWNTTVYGWGEQFGGISALSQCDDLPDVLKPGCQWRFEWFENADNPSFTFREVTCPRVITDKTGCIRTK